MSEGAADGRRPPGPDRTTAPPPGVNLAGYFRSVLGVGEVARALVDALESQGVAVAPVGLLAGDFDEHEGGPPEGHGPDPTFPINLICVNAQGIPVFVDRMGPAFFEDRHSIGVWWWEVEAFPRRWLGAFDHVDEVWAGSNHVAAALSAVSPVPVVKVTTPVAIGPFEELSRERLGLPEGFLFLFVFDYNSVAKRKNPLGAITAFARAFEPGSGASLVLKCVGSERFTSDHDRLLAAAGEHPDVHVIDRPLPSAEKTALLAACDCYVSLHRAEGFGLPMAEAMALGKPVVATGYSGNLDFMTAENSWLVDYSLEPIGAGAEPYPAEGVWAEPDVDHAARLMRAVQEDATAAQNRAARGRADIERTHSAEAAGRSMASRLALIAERWGQEPSPSGREEPASAEVARRISVGPVASPKLAAPRRALRSLALRATKPYAAFERSVDEELLRSVRALERRVEAISAAGAALGERLAKLEAEAERSAPSADGLLEHSAAGVVRGYGGDGAAPPVAPASTPPRSYDRLIADRTPTLELAGDDGQLRSAADGSLGAVIAREVVERLRSEQLPEFFALALRKLHAAGVLIVETPNPHASGALKEFWADPSHTRPLFPEAAARAVPGDGISGGIRLSPRGVGQCGGRPRARAELRAGGGRGR